MPNGYSITATIAFQTSQAALRNVQSQVQSAISGIRGRVAVEIDPRTQAEIQRLSANLQAVQAQIKGMTSVASQASGATGRIASSMSSAAEQGRALGNSLKAASAGMTSFASSAAAAAVGVGGFGATVGELAGHIRASLKEAINFDSGLNKIRQISGETATQVREVGDVVMGLSANLGVASKDLVEAAVTLKQAGLSAREVKVALESVAAASLAPNFSSMKQIVEGSVAAYQQFGKSVTDLRERLGAMNAVAGDFAVEAGDLVTVVQKAGGAASQAGLEFNEFLGLFTSIRATTRESADSISTGLRTIFTRLQRNETVDALKDLGINLRHTRDEARSLGQEDLEGHFVGAYEAVRRLSEGLGKLKTTDPRYASVLNELGGYRQVSRVLPLVQQFGEAQKALNVARLGSASLEAAAATRQDALAAKFAKTREEFQKFANELVQSRGFRNAVDGLLEMANALIQVLNATKPLIPMFTALAGAKLFQGAAQFGKGLYEGVTGPVGGRGAGPSRLRFSAGGVVPGSGEGDTVPAWLEPNEFVLNKQAVARLGLPFLRDLNQGRRRFAEGGRVPAFGDLFPALEAELRKKLRGVLGRTNLKGVDFDEVLNSAVVRMLETHAGGGLPGDTTSLHEFLVAEGVRGGRNLLRGLEREQKRSTVPVNDLLADARPAPRYGPGLREMAARYQSQGKYASTLGAARAGELLDEAARSGVVDDAELAALRDRHGVVRPQTAAFRDGGLVVESARNLALAQQALVDIGLPRFDLTKLVNSLHFVHKSVLGPDILGGFSLSGKGALVRAGMRLPVVAHEILGHAASRRAAEMAGSGDRLASSLPDSPFMATALASLRGLIPAVMSRGTLERYIKLYNGRTDLLADEGLAWGVEAFVHDRWHKAGRGPLSDKLKRVFGSKDVQQVFREVRDGVIPEVRKLTGKDAADALPDFDDDVDRLRAFIAGRTVRPRKLAGGGLVPGPAGDWTDSVPADLPVGSFVVRKQSVRSVGSNALHALASGGHIPARVMPGEFVFSPDEAARVGVSNLDRLNRTGRLPFADGGPVGQPRRRPGEVVAPLSSFPEAEARFAPLLEEVRRAAAQLGLTLRDTTRVLVEFVDGVPRLRAVLGERAGRQPRPSYTPVPESVPDEEYERQLDAVRDRGRAALSRPTYRELQRRAAALGLSGAGTREELEARLAGPSRPPGGTPLALPGPDPARKALPPYHPPDVYGFLPAGVPIAASGGGTAGYWVGGGVPPPAPTPPSGGDTYRFMRTVGAATGTQRPSPVLGRTDGVYGLKPTDEEVAARRAAGVAARRAEEERRAALGAKWDEADRALMAKAADRERRGTYRKAGLRTTGAGDLAEAHSLLEVSARGGNDLLSSQTQSEIATRARSRVEAELTKAVEGQLKALHPAITSTEAYRKALDLADDALTRNAAVLRSAGGRVAGLESLGAQLASQGLAPTGAAAGVWGNVRRRAGRVWTGLKDSFSGGGVGALAALSGAGILAGQIEPDKDDFKTAAVTGNAAGVYARSVGAGVLTGAATGAGVGMLFGPSGAAVGAAVGGLGGFAQSLQQTSKDVREARLGESLTRLSDLFSTAANTVKNGGLAGLDPSDLRREIERVQAEVNTKVGEGSSGFWGRARPDEVAALRLKETRAAFGSVAGAMVAALTKEAEKYAKTNPDDKPADLAKRLASDPTAGQLLNTLASTRGVPLDRVVKEFADGVEAAQRQNRLQADLEKGRAASERTATALHRLADAVSGAADATAVFDTRMAVLNNVFSGQGGPGRATAASGATFGAATGPEFARSVAAVKAALGAGGGEFSKSVEAGDRVARALPSVLASLGAVDLGPDDTYTTKARKLLRGQLLPGMTEDQQKNHLKTDKTLDDFIEAVVARIGHVAADAKDGEGFVTRLKNSPDKVLKEVTEAAVAPNREAMERMSRDLDAAAGKFSDGLTAARQMADVVGEARDRAAEFALGRARARADLAGDRTGRAPIDLLSLPELQAPFSARQQRLTGLSGPLAGAAGRDPEVVAALLRKVNEDVEKATAERDSAVGDKDRFASAAANLDRLTGQAQNLQAALKNLADVSARTAAIQEKLNAATLNRDSRLGYAEKYFMASPEQQMRMKRGQALVAGVDRGRVNPDNFTPDEMRLFIETANDFGQARLASGRTAEGLKRQVVGGRPGVLDAGQEKERAGLQNDFVNVFKTAELAQNALVEFQKTVHEKFISELRGLHEAFFARLAANYAAEKVAGLRSAYTAAQVDRAGLARDEKARGLLARLGVTDKAGLDAFRGSEGLVRNFFDLEKQLKDMTPTPGKADEARNAVAADLPRVLAEASRGRSDALRGILTGRGLEKMAPEHAEAALRSMTEDLGKARVVFPAMSPEQRDAALKQIVDRGLNTGFVGSGLDVMRKREDASRELRARGIDPDALAGLGDGDRNSLTDVFKNTTFDLTNFDARVKEAEASLARLKTQLEAAELALRQGKGAGPGSGGFLSGAMQMVFRSGGGFTPRGTDTVPAMLTPGEFVVNRASAEANRDLLERLNAARGPVYLADGGEAARRVMEGKSTAAEDIAVATGLGDGAVPPFPALRRRRGENDLDWAIRQSRADLNRGLFEGADTSSAAANHAGLMGMKNDLARFQKSEVERKQKEAFDAALPGMLLDARSRQESAGLGLEQALYRGGVDDVAVGAAFHGRHAARVMFDDRFGATTYLERAKGVSPTFATTRALAEARMGMTYEEAAFREEERRRGIDRTREISRRGWDEWMKYAPKKKPLTPTAPFVGLPVGFAGGGLVGGTGGGDTVPAMLTPGEFVMTRDATRAVGAGNLDRLNYLAGGGPVRYLAGGGGAGPEGVSVTPTNGGRTQPGGGPDSNAALVEAMKSFGQNTSLLEGAMKTFDAGVNKLAGVMEKFPTEVTHTFRGSLEVVHNGAEVMHAFGDELDRRMAAYFTEHVAREFQARLPDAPRPLRADTGRFG